MENLNREVKTDLEDILSLISCAEQYGFADDILFDAFSEIIGNTLTDEEIEWYARSIEAKKGYGEEDYENIKEILEEFKSKYIK